MDYVLSGVGSVLRGGVVKGGVKEAVKGLKGSGATLTKGLQKSSIPIIRGLKSSSSQVVNTPKIIKNAVALTSKLPVGFGIKNTLRVFKNKIAQDLASLSKTVLSKDAAARLSNILTENLVNVKKSRTLKTIFENARANETWGNYLLRNGKSAGQAVVDMVKGGAENIAIDKSISLTSKVLLGGASTVAGGVTAGIVADKLKK